MSLVAMRIIRPVALSLASIVLLAACGTAADVTHPNVVEECQREGVMATIAAVLPERPSPGWVALADHPYDGCGDEDMQIPNVTRVFVAGPGATSPAAFYEDVIRDARSSGWTRDTSCGAPLWVSRGEAPLVLRLSKVNSRKLTIGVYAPATLEEYCEYFL